eukprot:gene16311-19399_t
MSLAKNPTDVQSQRFTNPSTPKPANGEKQGDASDLCRGLIDQCKRSEGPNSYGCGHAFKQCPRSMIVQMCKAKDSPIFFQPMCEDFLAQPDTLKPSTPKPSTPKPSNGGGGQEQQEYSDQEEEEEEYDDQEDEYDQEYDETQDEFDQEYQDQEENEYDQQYDDQEEEYNQENDEPQEDYEKDVGEEEADDEYDQQEFDDQVEEEGEYDQQLHDIVTEWLMCFPAKEVSWEVQASYCILNAKNAHIVTPIFPGPHPRLHDIVTEWLTCFPAKEVSSEAQVRILPMSQVLLRLCSHIINLLFFDLGRGQTHTIPKFITHLTLGHTFNESLTPGTLPPCLIHLTFGQVYNQPLQQGSLPSTLTHLVFGRDYNQQIPVGVLPANLTHLRFLGHRFNQLLLPGSLPKSLRHLVLSSAYDHSFDQGTLPDNLEQLTLVAGEYSHPIIQGTFPKSLVYLKLALRNQLVTFEAFTTEHLKHLSFDNGGLTSVGCSDDPILGLLPHLPYGDQIGNQQLHRSMFPPNLQHLEYSLNNDINTESLPLHLTNLTFLANLHIELTPGMIPPNLQHLTFGNDFNQQIQPNVLPTTLTTLTFGTRFNRPLTRDNLPPNIQHLTVGAIRQQVITRIYNSLANPYSPLKRIEWLTMYQVRWRAFNKEPQQHLATMMANIQSHDDFLVLLDNCPRLGTLRIGERVETEDGFSSQPLVDYLIAQTTL